MLRRNYPKIISLALYLAAGVALGLIWQAVTGSPDMPWWIVLALVLAASLVGDLAEGLLLSRQARRQRQGLVRHRKAGA